MARSVEVPLEKSLTAAIGLLYQRKEAGAALIRILEKYNRSGFRHASSCSGLEPVSGSGWAHPEKDATATAYRQKLQRLYLRRAVVDELIRSIEAYTTLTQSITGRQAGPQANQ